MFDLYKMVGDAVLRRVADAPHLPELREGNELGRRDHLDWVRGIFARNLENLPEPDRTELFIALVAATDVYVWQIPMRDQAPARPVAEAVVVRMIGSLIGRD